MGIHVIIFVPLNVCMDTLPLLYPILAFFPIFKMVRALVTCMVHNEQRGSSMFHFCFLHLSPRLLKMVYIEADLCPARLLGANHENDIKERVTWAQATHIMV